MKICTSCLRPKKRSEFYKRRNGTSLNPKCKSCQSSYHRNWYKKNKRVVIQRSRKRNEKVRLRNYDIIHNMKDVPCADCKIKYPHWIMQFDHLNSLNKEADISDLATYASVETLLNEIAKCEVVCANCHANRTYMRRLVPSGMEKVCKTFEPGSTPGLAF